MARSIEKFAHPEYLKLAPVYEALRDCYDGADAIKSKGEKYLPRLSAQSQSDYDNYKFRALFFPITGKTCATLVGLSMSEEPEVTYPDFMGPYFSDDQPGYQFTELLLGTLREVLLMGRYGLLIDAPTGGGDPTPCAYIAENIINWNHSEDGKLIMLLLREFYTSRGDGEFELKVHTRYRHCFISPQNVYTVRTLNEDLDPMGLDVVPVFSGKSLDYIPFVCIGASGVHMSPDKPPMQDLAIVNLSHYLSSADLEWGRHLTGLPTPVISGVDTATTLHVGGTKAWVLPDASAKAYYMEFLGQGLGSLEKALTDKIGLMASLSARMVDTSTRGSEAAETVRLRYMSESASLVHVMWSVETALEIFFNMIAALKQSGAGEVEIEFSKDILGPKMTFGDLKILFEGFFRGALSKESLIYNLRKMDVLDPSKTDEEEMGSLQTPEPKTPNADNQGA